MAAPAVEWKVKTALQAVFRRVEAAAKRSGRRPEEVRVVAVGKTKPVSLIRDLYDAGHRCFGENYVQEFIQKAPQLPDDIKWHFIGHLQSNKVKPLLAAVPNLDMVESVDNEKIANLLDRTVVTNLGRKPLKVLVQVNTSGEESKSGVEPSDCVALAKHVSLNCPNLAFSGLMTIGRPDRDSTPENFQLFFFFFCIILFGVFLNVELQVLCWCKDEVCRELGINGGQCELSMGMSGDFEKAIEMGSTNVRIGSTIFGPREYLKKETP